MDLENEKLEDCLKIGMMFLTNEEFLRDREFQFREIDVLKVYISNQISVDEYKRRYDVTDERIASIYNRTIKKVLMIVRSFLNPIKDDSPYETIDSLTKRAISYEKKLIEIRSNLDQILQEPLYKKVMLTKIEHLDLSVRLYNVLSMAGLKTFNDMLVRKDEIFTKNLLGKKLQEEYLKIITFFDFDTTND